MTIIAGIYPCGPPWLKGKLCAGVHSHFSVSRIIENAGYDLLTSATVSEISSYNELPDGTGYQAIRGQFLGNSATLLFEELKKPSFNVDYNFDFSAENVRYSVPTSSISESINEFEKCVGSPISP